MTISRISFSRNRSSGRPVWKALVVAGVLGMGAASAWAQSTLGSMPVNPVLGGTNSMQGQTLNNTTANDRARSGAPLGVGTPPATGALPSSSTAIPGIPVGTGPSSSTLPGAGAVGGSAAMGPGSAAGIPGAGTSGAMGGAAYGSGLSTPGAGLSGGAAGGMGGAGAAGAGAGAGVGAGAAGGAR